MGIPQFDVNGYALPYDDDDVLADDGLIRHIPASQIVSDPKAPTGRRLSSGSFSPSSIPHRGISIDLERLIVESGDDRLHYVPEGQGAARLVAVTVRAMDLVVGQNPRPKNHYHGEIWGANGVVSKQKRRLLARSAEILAWP